MFTDQIELYIPPKKGTKHVLRVIREILYFKPQGTRTNMTAAVEHVNRILKRKSIVFVISDFMDSGFESALSVASRKHDLIAITIGDEREELLSDSGVIALEDAETGQICLVDTSSRKVRRNYWNIIQKRQTELENFFKRVGIDRIDLKTGQNYDEELVRFFKKRMRQFR